MSFPPYMDTHEVHAHLLSIEDKEQKEMNSDSCYLWTDQNQYGVTAKKLCKLSPQIVQMIKCYLDGQARSQAQQHRPHHLKQVPYPVQVRLSPKAWHLPQLPILQNSHLPLLAWALARRSSSFSGSRLTTGSSRSSSAERLLDCSYSVQAPGWKRPDQDSSSPRMLGWNTEQQLTKKSGIISRQQLTDNVSLLNETAAHWMSGVIKSTANWKCQEWSRQHLIEMSGVKTEQQLGHLEN
jgi:hypothetical protein